MTTPIPGTCGNQPPSETRGKRNRLSRAASLLQPQETECSTPKELGSGGGEHRCSQFPSVRGGSSVNPAVCVGSLQEATLMGTESQDAARQTAQAAWWHRSPRRALRLSEPPQESSSSYFPEPHAPGVSVTGLRFRAQIGTKQDSLRRNERILNHCTHSNGCRFVAVNKNGRGTVFL